MQKTLKFFETDRKGVLTLILEKKNQMVNRDSPFNRVMT